jgi:hypothetical protein
MGMRPPVMTYPLLGFIDLPPAVGVASFLIIGSLLIFFGIFSKAALSYTSNRFSPHWLLVSILLVVFGISKLVLFARASPRLLYIQTVLSTAPFSGRYFHMKSGSHPDIL